MIDQLLFVAPTNTKRKPRESIPRGCTSSLITHPSSLPLSLWLRLQKRKHQRRGREGFGVACGDHPGLVCADAVEPHLSEGGIERRIVARSVVAVACAPVAAATFRGDLQAVLIHFMLAQSGAFLQGTPVPLFLPWRPRSNTTPLMMVQAVARKTRLAHPPDASQQSQKCS